MAVTAFVFPLVFTAAFNKEIDLLDDAIKVALTTSIYAVDQDTHDYFNDVTNEVVGTGYTAGGVALATDTITYTAGTNVWKYDADDSSWTTATITARFAVVYDSTPATAATQPLICYQNFGADVVSTAGTFLITWNASGIFTITAS